MTGLRSADWFGGDDEVALLHRAALRSSLAADETIGSRPVIGVTVSGSALNPCNAVMGPRIAAILEGIADAGGIGVELPSMSLGEDLMKPSAMLYRNLLSMEVEEYLRSYPIDGVVITGICDKSLPGGLMGALSADLPTIVHAGGARPAACLNARELGTTDVWRMTHQRAAGTISNGEWAALETALSSGRGACNVMGTASTMALLIEALGLMLPGTAVIPADDAAGVVAARQTGRAAVALATAGTRPSDLLTAASFRNAARVLAAVGGSTNAVIHLLALAGRAGVPLSLDDIHIAAQALPVIVDVEPAGRKLVDALHRDGGLPAVLASIAAWLEPEARTVDGRTTGEIAAAANPVGVVHSVVDPVVAAPALTVVTGGLAPDGAVLKRATASERLLQHTGPALVFEDYHDMRARVQDPDLAVTADTVLVMRGCGPVGGPGMPEWGMIPIPTKLAEQGIDDMVRITDARMSGTSYGTVFLHVAPESAVGGPLALVRDGDLVRVDVAARRIDLLVDDAELERRRAAWQPPPSAHTRGWPRLYREHVLQADRGADLDFLALPAGQRPRLIPPTIGRS